MVILS